MSKKSQPLAVRKAKEFNTKPLRNPKLTKELSYVLGVLYGDGHVSQRRTILSAIDKDFVQAFKNNLEEWSGYKTRFYTRLIKPDNKIKNRKVQWVCYLDSVKIEKFIKRFHYKKIARTIDKLNFIKGFFDSEGSFSKDYELIAYNTNYKRLKLISQFLFDLGLENRIKTYTVKNINKVDIKYHYLKVFGKARYLFYQKIGFSIERKQKNLKIGSKKSDKENTRRIKNDRRIQRKH